MKCVSISRTAGIALSVAMSLAASTALAADVPRTFTKAASVNAAYDWTGFYVGGQGGGFYGRDNVSTPGGELLSPLSIHGGNFFAGGYTGFNYQMGNLVTGIEGDFSSILGSRALSAQQATIVPGTFVTGATKPKWLGTVSARLGFAMNNWLLYGKIGGAWMKADYTGNVELGNGTVLGTQTLSSTRSGWLAGAGLEYGWNPNWVSRFEYNYINFGSKRLNYTLAGLNAADIDSKAHVVKLGLAYKFGGR